MTGETGMGFKGLTSENESRKAVESSVLGATLLGIVVRGLVTGTGAAVSGGKGVMESCASRVVQHMIEIINATYFTIRFAKIGTQLLCSEITRQSDMKFRLPKIKRCIIPPAECPGQV